MMGWIRRIFGHKLVIGYFGYCGYREAFRTGYQLKDLIFDSSRGDFLFVIEDRGVIKNLRISLVSAVAHGIINIAPLVGHKMIMFEEVLKDRGFVVGGSGYYWNKFSSGMLVECFFRDGSVLVFIHGDGGREEVVVYNSDELKKLIDDIWK